MPCPPSCLLTLAFVLEYRDEKLKTEVLLVGLGSVGMDDSPPLLRSEFLPLKEVSECFDIPRILMTSESSALRDDGGPTLDT